LVYVEIACCQAQSVARRSDGSVVAWGDNTFGQGNAPALQQGSGYSQVAAGAGIDIAIVGPMSSFVGSGSGCAGSLPASRLVPDDTPRVGSALRVRLFDLPLSAALVVMGLQSQTLDLTAFGMPGCTAFTSADGVQFVAGSNQQAVFSLAIPNSLALVGAVAHFQALVPDPTAGNPLGAVMSDAATAVVGR